MNCREESTWWERHAIFFLFPFPFDIGTERSPFSKCVQALFVHMVNGFNPNFPLTLVQRDPLFRNVFKLYLSTWLMVLIQISLLYVLFYSDHLIFHCAFVLCDPSVFFDVQKIKTSLGGDNRASDKH